MDNQARNAGQLSAVQIPNSDTLQLLAGTAAEKLEINNARLKAQADKFFGYPGESVGIEKNPPEDDSLAGLLHRINRLTFETEFILNRFN